MDELTLEVPDRQRWRSWLDRNHDTDAIVWLVIYKRSTGRQWLTYPEALAEAICYGWIDSRLKRVDSEKHIIRFTRRKKRTAWSLTNLRMAKSLIENGAMTRHGMVMLPSDLDREIEAAEEQERQELEIPNDLSLALTEAGLLDAFEALSRSRRRTFNRWVTDAKRSETRKERVRQAAFLIAKNEMPMPMAKKATDKKDGL